MGCNTSSIKSVIDPSKLDQLEKTVDQTANVVKDTITEAKSQLENISNMDLVKGASLITNALTSDGKSRPEESMDKTKNLEEEEEVDIDLNDPEVGKAAVKIQAGFKNFMAGKKKSKPSDASVDSADSKETKTNE